MDQEKGLLEASLRGDTAAFERIVGQYQGLICSITLGATGRLEASEELAQETFLRAWKSLTQLKELDKFRAWLCSIARNCIQNYLRDQKRHAAEIPGSAELAEAVPSDSESVPESLIRQEDEAMMQQALMQIPQEYRDVLILFYRQQQSVAQVAVMLELTEGNVRTRLHRGRELLREEVAGRIEKTLQRTASGKQFTKAVMVAIGGLAVGTAATSQAAAVSSTGTSSLLTGVGMKIAAAAAVVIIGAGVLTYYLNNKPDKAEVPRVLNLDSRLRGNDTSGEQSETPVTTVKPVEIETETTASQVPVVPAAENTQLLHPVQKAVVVPNDICDFKPRGVLSGLITDIETGRPVTDAEIELCTPVCEVAKTDEHGFYYFDQIEQDGNYNISINSIDYVGLYDYRKQPRINLQKDKQAVQHFQFHKACKLEIHVMDEDGRPIAKAHVNSTALSDSYKMEIGSSIYTRRTNKEGKILLGGFYPNDTYLITITHCGPDIKVEGKPYASRIGLWDYAPAGLQIYLDKPGEIEYAEVILEKGRFVRGIAKYKDGQPADDVNISAYPDWWYSNYCPQSVDVEPNGLFTLEQIVPGNYSIHAGIPTGEGSTSSHNLFNCVLPFEEDKLLEVMLPFNSPGSLVAIRGHATITGDRKPSYVHINAFSSTGQYCHGRFVNGIQDNVSGDFIIDRLEPGIYTVQFSGDGVEKILENITAPAEGLVVELVSISKPKLSGTVIDAQTKQPIQEFQVRVKKIQTLRGSNYVQQDQFNSFINTNGAFEVLTVGPGIFQVQVAANGYTPIWSEPINTDQNAPVEIVLTTDGASIRGVVMNEDGRPVNGAKVIPLSLAGGFGLNSNETFVSDKGAVTTNEEGEFVLNHLAAGSETLKVTHPDYTASIVKGLEAVTGRCTDNVKVILLTGGIVEGFVYDSDGKPVDGAVICAAEKDNYGSPIEQADQLGTGVTEPNGFYRIDNLPRQVCYLIRQNEWNVDGVILRAIMPGPGKISRVDFGGKNKLYGQIILDGQPLANQKIQLNQPSVDVCKAYTVTDSKGYFSFNGIPAGRHRILYTKDRHMDSLAEFEYAGRDMDMGVIPRSGTELALTLKQPQDASWSISNVYLIDSKDNFFYDENRGQQDVGQSHVFKSLHSGDYKLMIQRKDGLLYNGTVTLNEQEQNVNLEFPLPADTTELFGSLSADIVEIDLVNETKTLEGSIYKNHDGSYALTCLPAGQYHLSLAGYAKEGSTLSVYLSPGQKTRLDIEGSQLKKLPLAQFEVTAVSENGEMIDGAEVILEKDSQTIRAEWAYGGGKYIFFSTTPGEYLLRVQYKNCREVQKNIVLKPTPADSRRHTERNKITIFLEPDSR
jgi:RNA polymerase sigma factor (sigma-70 family)